MSNLNVSLEIKVSALFDGLNISETLIGEHSAEE